MEEIWKPIPDYEGFYEVSDLGRIRSLHQTRRHRAKSDFVAQCDLRGYKTCVLSKEGIRRTKMVHRLVAIAFLGMPVDVDSTVNHKNLDKADNRPENLEWLSLANNIRHAAPKIPRLRGEQVPWKKLTEDDVRTMRAMYAAGGVTLDQLSQKFGVSGVTCHNIIRRRKWAHVE